jgi:UDP-glucose 4-epimerase
MNGNYILVTGGAGYIGSHFVKLLKEKNYKIIVLDNLSRGHKEAIPEGVIFEQVDLLDKKKLRVTLLKYKINVVVHFAAFAYVGESVQNPSMYFQNNVLGGYNLIETCRELNIKNLILSSTCSIYGNPNCIPISEETSPQPINPYAISKYIVELVLRDYHRTYNLNYLILRYFNAAGCDFDGNIGESHDPEPHLIPLVIDTALGNRDKIKIFGDDYTTKDGTCIRDYIHVNDLADAHLKGIQYLLEKKPSTLINLGTSIGNSVKEIIYKVEKISGVKINFEIVERREGDPAILIADNQRAKELLNWEPKIGLDGIIRSAFNWQKNKKF